MHPPAHGPSPADALHTERERLTRTGHWWLLACLGGGLAWAAWAPLQEGVPAPAQVVIDSRRVAVQHLQGGIVRKVHVQEGQQVQADQPLVTLDDQTGKAQYMQARQNLSVLQTSLVAQQGTLEGLARTLRQRREQEQLITQELQAIRGLVKDGYAPKVQQLQLERALVESQTQQSELLINQERTRQAMAELQHQIKAAQERLAAAEQDLSLLTLRASTSGQIMGVQLLGEGSVIQPAQRLMDIAPQGPTLVLEARIPPQWVDRIAPGQKVHVRFSNFSQALQVVAEGELQSVSPDVLSDNPANQAPYYLARVGLTEAGRQALAPHTLRAGMPADVVVLTGERSLLQYLLQPFAKRMGASLKEQ